MSWRPVRFRERIAVPNSGPLRVDASDQREVMEQFKLGLGPERGIVCEGMEREVKLNKSIEMF